MNKNHVYLSLLILLSSCYSYKNTTIDNISKNQHYKIKETSKRFLKIKVDSIANNVIYFSKKRELKTLQLTDKSIVKVRKFSTLKTILLPVGIIGGMVIIIDNTMNNLGKNIDIDFQPPP